MKITGFQGERWEGGRERENLRNGHEILKNHLTNISLLFIFLQGLDGVLFYFMVLIFEVLCQSCFLSVIWVPCPGTIPHFLLQILNYLQWNLLSSCLHNLFCDNTYPNLKPREKKVSPTIRFELQREREVMRQQAVTLRARLIQKLLRGGIDDKISKYSLFALLTALIFCAMAKY